MKEVMLLDENDLLEGNDWVRPLVFLPDSFHGEVVVNTANTYSGCPMNHPKWVRASKIFGPCWLGKKIGMVDQNQRYEFVRGEIPEQHRHT